jgi:hypothetical protein
LSTTSAPHLLVIDASLDKRIATELSYRQREAVALSALHMQHLDDDDLLPELFVRVPDRNWCLVTADDWMPDDWAEIIERLRPTIATIGPRTSDDYNDDQWGRDVVHRWAHVMQRQTAHTVRRYRLGAHAPWRPRRRRR